MVTVILISVSEEWILYGDMLSFLSYKPLVAGFDFNLEKLMSSSQCGLFSLFSLDNEHHEKPGEVKEW